MANQPAFYRPADGEVADIFITPGHHLNGRWRFTGTGACWTSAREVNTGRTELFAPEFLASYIARGFFTIVTEA